MRERNICLASTMRSAIARTSSLRPRTLSVDSISDEQHVVCRYSHTCKWLPATASQWSRLAIILKCPSSSEIWEKKAVLLQGNRVMPQLFDFFGLKFADDIRYKFKSSQASKASAKQNLTQNDDSMPLSHVFWSQWKGDKALRNTIQ